jgi:hypothetical protein
METYSEQLVLDKEFSLDSTTHPFIEFVEEDKSHYPTANSKGFIDPDSDFLVGDSGGFLMNISFKFINTHLFSEVAEHHEQTGRYTDAIKGTNEYRAFWHTEKERRSKGMIAPCKLLPNGQIVNLRITGNHYNFLNYSRITRTLNEKEKAFYENLGLNIKEKEAFPRFWDAHYWRFKCMEFAEYNGFNEAIGKSRRKGYSYLESSASANTMNLVPNYHVVFAAYDIDYLTSVDSTCDMLKRNLDWLEMHTEWRRGYISEPLDNIELGYKLKAEGHKKFGHRSSSIGVSCRDNPSAAIGKKAGKIKFEESGKFPNLLDTLEVTISATESGRISVGNLVIYGTGGAKQADWLAFETAFYEPGAYNMMPFENVWDKNARGEVCGFFHPNIWAMEDEDFICLDKEGNSNLRVALGFDVKDKEKAKRTKSLSKYVIFCSQRANSPGEAFSGATENIFTSPELNEFIKKISHDPAYKFYQDGRIVGGSNGVVFKNNNILANEGNKVHPYIEDVPFKRETDTAGCVRIYHHPFTVNGVIPDNLYEIEYDPVAVDKDKDDVSIKNSLACIRVKLMPNNLTPYVIKNPAGLTVAMFCGRHNTVSEDDALALLMAKYYNAKIEAEVNRGDVVKNFQVWKALNYLRTDPLIHINRNIATRSESSYGMVVTPRLKLDGIGYVRDELYTIIGYRPDTTPIYAFETELDLPTLKEFQKFTMRKGHNFDRISARIVGSFYNRAFEAMGLKAVVRNINTNSVLSQVYKPNRFRN